MFTTEILLKIFKNAQAAVDDFLWQQQLRYYYTTEEKDVVIKQLNSTLNYGYEYLGSSTRLVITSLTDRCWMTITSVLNIRLGAAPAGPAGTGKTDSIKDLDKGLGDFELYSINPIRWTTKWWRSCLLDMLTRDLGHD